MKKKSKGLERVKRRKNFLPTLLLAIIFWVGFGWLTFSQNPSGNLIIIFFLLLFMAVFLTLALALANSRRGFLISLWLLVFLIFRYFALANLLNLVLLSGIIVGLELYLKQN
ncbi:hypothetical protein ACFL0Y_02660 [Patescibacteria group bacterium]